jgi:phosphoenolpyruvate-protein phosphotransferase (PTS system enzyme I)
MITTLEEIRRVRAMVGEARQRLQAAGNVFGEVALGLMLEVPAAAVTIDVLLQEVDFVSIGSNDLVQYLMAADRDNPKVSHLCQPLSLPVLRTLQRVIQLCVQAGKKVTVCGEMAGSPRGFVLLYGLGLRSFSMSPAFVPTIKELLSRLTAAETQAIAAEALRLTTTEEIRSFMRGQIERLCPSLKLLDM